MLDTLLIKNRLKIIDLSMPLENGFFDRTAPRIAYEDHKKGAEGFCNRWDIPKKDFFEEFYAIETITLMSHSGTHMDAPWHYGPTSEGKPAKTTDQIPLEWCYGNGVVLDLTHKQSGELITKNDIIEALHKISYKLVPEDIVLLRTDASKHFKERDFEFMHPGMSREATLWLIDQGIKVMGTDGWGWDRPSNIMAAEYKNGVRGDLWAAHLLGKEREYCHIEKLCNLDKIPKPYGFIFFAFPVKIKGGSGGWVRAVAIAEE